MATDQWNALYSAKRRRNKTLMWSGVALAAIVSIFMYSLPHFL